MSEGQQADIMTKVLLTKKFEIQRLLLGVLMNNLMNEYLKIKKCLETHTLEIFCVK